MTTTSKIGPGPEPGVGAPALNNDQPTVELARRNRQIT
jgi:hypothetical protein